MFLRDKFFTDLASIPVYGLCFAEDGGDGDHTPGSGDDSQSPKSDGDDSQSQKSGDQKPEDVVPMDAHLSRVERAKRAAKREAEESLLKKLGAKSLDEVDGIVERLRAGETETDRLKREADTEAAEKARLADENKQFRQERRERAISDSISDAIEAEAKKVGDKPGRKVNNPRQVQQLLRGRLSYEDGDDGKPGKVVVLKESGDPDHGSNVGKLLKGFLDDNDHFLESPIKHGGAGSRPTAGGGPTGGGKATAATFAGRQARYRQMVAEGKFKD